MESTLSSQFEVIESLPWSISDFAVAAYKARETPPGDTPGRVVLMRRLPAGTDTPETRAASSLYASLPLHPNILTHFGLAEVSTGELPAGTYAISEWARGISLKERIRRVAPFSTAVSLDIAIAVAQVLARAKSLGLEHGDLRTAHVLLTSEGHVKVADFALSRAIREAEGETVPTETAVHAVARLLYEMVTAEAAPIGDAPLLARSITPSTPLALHGIIEKATQGSAAETYATLEALLLDLQTAREDSRSGRPLTWNPMSPPQKPAPRAAEAITKAAAEIVKEEKTMAAAGTTRRKRPGQDEFADDDYYDEPERGALSVWLRRAVMLIVILIVVGVVFLVAYMFMLVSGVPSDITVPNLIGKQFTDAQKAASQEHFVLTEESHDYSNTWPQGAIYQQTPMPGRSIKSGKEVQVYVSDGPQLLDVPDLSQMTVSKAEGVLQDSGLPVGSIDKQYDPVVPKGIVTTQQPAAGSNVSRVTAINLTVSNGPPPPPAPGNVSATSTIPGEIDLSWDDVPIAATYNVYRDGAKIASALPQTTYSDVGLTDSGSHSYTITAVNSNGESPQSQPVTSAAEPADMTPPVTTPDDQTPGDSNLGATPPLPTVSTAAVAPKQRQFEIKFQVPQTGGRHNVQIEVQDTTGANIVYDEDKYSGETVDENFTAFGNRVVFRIFLDGKLVKQETK